ncbi:MAG: ComEC/Rec2 family competence protein [Clostridia bacterium]|nr:ComEC/Rec2 family competence protein [Clostridia bacterium]
MRRPLLLFLYAQTVAILILYYLNPLGLSSLLAPKSRLIPYAESVYSTSGTVERVQMKENYVALTVNTGHEKFLVRLSGIEDETEALDLGGRKITVTGEITLPTARRNPGCFDYRLYLKSRGIYTLMQVSKFRIERGNVTRPITHLMCVAKGRFYRAVRPFMPEENFSVMAGLLFGDKEYMEEDLYEEFQTNGIAHVLAVSGLHVGLLYAIVVKLLGGRRNYISTTITLILLYCYAALSGFSVSVLRASLMICLNLLAFHLRRRYDMVCAATITAIVFLLINPYQLFDSGFQLSFVAAYTLGFALPWAQSKIIKLSNDKRSEKLYAVLIACVPAILIHIGMAPLIAFHFLNYSFVSLLINPIAIALAGLILPTGLALFFISFIGITFLTNISSAPCSFFATLLRMLSAFGHSLHLSGSCTAPPFGLLVLYYIFFFWFFSETRYVLNRRRMHKELFGVFGVLAASCIFIPPILGITDSPLPWKYPTSYVTFVDVGQGDCIHLNLDGFNVLIDGGGNYYKNIGKNTVKPYLLKNGIRKIDLAIATHKDLDHSRGLEELAECFPVEEYIMGGKSNEDCLVCSINIEGVDFLLMADADYERETSILQANPGLKADVIKLGHHGSKTSSSPSFIDSVSPKMAIISCGLNNSYGHPAPTVVELLNDFGIIYGRTDHDGAVCFIKSTDNYALFSNAAKDKYWLIQKNK